VWRVKERRTEAATTVRMARCGLTGEVATVVALCQSRLPATQERARSAGLPLPRLSLCVTRHR